MKYLLLFESSAGLRRTSSPSSKSATKQVGKQVGLRNLIDRSRGAVTDALERIRLPASARPLLVRKELDLVQLEDRIMLSASPVGDLLMPVNAVLEVGEELSATAALPSTVDHADVTTPAQSDRKVATQIELVFVDQGVQDY